MNTDALAEKLTELVLEKLQNEDCDQNGEKQVAVFGDIPQNLLCEQGYTLRCGKTCEDLVGCDYVVMSMESFRAIHGDMLGKAEPQAGTTVDLKQKRHILKKDLEKAQLQAGNVLLVDRQASLTPLAKEYARQLSVQIERI